MCPMLEHLNAKFNASIVISPYTRARCVYEYLAPSLSDLTAFGCLQNVVLDESVHFQTPITEGLCRQHMNCGFHFCSRTWSAEISSFEPPNGTSGHCAQLQMDTEGAALLVWLRGAFRATYASIINDFETPQMLTFMDNFCAFLHGQGE